jgi:ABC-2 type transport system permease protein
MPPKLFEIGFAHLGVALVLLGLAQLLFTRLENKIPERL